MLKPRLAAKGLVSVYERLERPLVPVLARMEQRGISVDRQILSRLSGELAQGAARLEEEIYGLVGERINIGSPKQLGDILFGRMGLPGGSKTKTGQWSTSAQLLEDLAAEGHELPRKIVDWRQLTKLKSTYTDALPGFIHPDTKRVHTSYALAATTTGRLSSSDPNLQNIPVRTAEGRKIRTAFIADKGHKLVSADYSQIELRVLAHVAEIPQLTQAFADGADIHAITASEMFNVPVEGMPSEVRRRAKAINFGIIYGIWPLVWPTSCRSRARKPAPTSRSISSASPASATTSRRPRPMPRTWLRRNHLRPPHPLPGDTIVESFDPRLQRARLDQCQVAGHRRRYHPPRHGAYGRGAGKGRAFRPYAAAGA
ncbi:hypothetical protein AJ88_14725 [Mesorhizobium amorphae CCBAU 01583]|nr:hypothetical protein AJ88_14725 [Mesorhizobium amorphae CCBAU 01583]